MKSVTFANGTEWACNSHSEGLFMRMSSGAWQQQRGTAQTPRFRSARQLGMFVRRECAATAERVGAFGAIVDTMGWEVSQ